MRKKRLLLMVSLAFLLLLILGGLIGAFLRIVNEIKYSLSYFIPYWLVNPIFFIGTILLIATIFQNIWPLIKRYNLNKFKSNSIKNRPPKNKIQAAKQTIEGIDLLIERIKDNIEKKGLKQERDKVSKELIRGDLVVVFFGTGSSGKTSIIRVLLNEIVGKVSASMGSTEISKCYRLRLKNLKRGIKLVDTPGIFEAGPLGRAREKDSREWATKSDLIIFVVDSDLRAEELKIIQYLGNLGKELLLVLNKCDLRGEKEEERLIYLLRGHCKDLIKVENIVSTSASPQSIPRPGERPWQPPPEIDQLLLRLAKVLHADGDELLADNILLQCRNLSDEGRKILDQQRLKEAKSTINRYSWISSGVVAATPLPGIDLLGTATVNAQMVIGIAKIYGIEITKSRAQELVFSVIQTLTGLGIIKGGVTLINSALTITIPTIILSRSVQSIAAAWLTRIAGASFITYFQQDQDWGDGGVQEVVRHHYDLNRRASSLNNFLDIAFKKVIEPLKQKNDRQLPPRSWPQEEADSLRFHEDQER